MQGLTRTARGLGRPSPAEARIVAALTGLGADLALSMPAHSSQALRAKLMASAADPVFMSGTTHAASGAGQALGSNAAAHPVTVTKAAAVGAKISSAIAPFVAPVAAGVLATNLAVAGAFVANHQGGVPTVATPVVATQTAAQKAQAAVKDALVGQIARLSALGRTYDQLTPAQLTAFVGLWSKQTTTLLGQLTSAVDLQRFLTMAKTEVDRVSPVLPAPAVAAVNQLLGAVSTTVTSPAPTQLPTQLPTPKPTAPSGIPNPLQSQLPVPLPTVTAPPLPLPGITLGPIIVKPL